MRRDRIIESPFMVDVENKIVVRSWRERLLTWPWEPWQKTKTIRITRPMEKIVMLDDGTVICHPSIAVRLKAELAKVIPMDRFREGGGGIGGII